MAQDSRIPSLDILRTLAIALVFTTHFGIFAEGDWFAKVGPFGWAGVDLFFVLSGYLIAGQLLRALRSRGKISLRDFYVRRGLRIWPNFFFVLGIYFLFPLTKERSQLPPLWRFLTFTQNFGLDYHAQGAFSHAWSLCVEEQFYLVLPFLLLFFFRRGRAWGAAALWGGDRVGWHGSALRTLAQICVALLPGRARERHRGALLPRNLLSHVLPARRASYGRGNRDTLAATAPCVGKARSAG